MNKFNTLSVFVALVSSCSRDCVSPDPVCTTANSVDETNNGDGTHGVDGPMGEPGVDWPEPAVGFDGTDLTGEEGQVGAPTMFSVEQGTFTLSDEMLEDLIMYFQSQKAEEEASQPTDTPEIWASEVQCQSDEDCDDGQGCTTETCDGGFCAHATVEGCKPCKTHADCKADKVCNGSSVGMLLYSCEEDSTCQPSMGVGQFCNNLCTSEPEVKCIDTCQTDTDCGVTDDPCLQNVCLHFAGSGNECRYNEPIEGCIPEE